ncbi:hypothetical protein ABIA96_007336 [Bradyrhizobium sp. LB11.1]
MHQRCPLWPEEQLPPVIQTAQCTSARYMLPVLTSGLSKALGARQDCIASPGRALMVAKGQLA